MTKPGTVVTVSAHLDMITAPTKIASRPIGNAVWQQLPAPSTDSAWCVWMPTFGKTHSNVNNSKRGKQQRRRKSGRT